MPNLYMYMVFSFRASFLVFHVVNACIRIGPVVCINFFLVEVKVMFSYGFENMFELWNYLHR